MCHAFLDAPSPSDDEATLAAAMVMIRLTAQLLAPADAFASDRPNRRPRHRRALSARDAGRPAAAARQTAPVITAFNARPRPRAKVELEAAWWSPTDWHATSLLGSVDAAPSVTVLPPVAA